MELRFVHLCGMIKFKAVKRAMFLLLLILGSCSMNAEQEASLNTAIRKHLKARNEGQLMTYISEMHPNAIAYYKRLGDDAFKDAFKLAAPDEPMPYFQDPTIQDTESDGQVLHVKIKVMRVEDHLFNLNADPVFLFAVSEDEGVSWYFISQHDYFNDAILKPDDRLIKKK